MWETLVIILNRPALKTLSQSRKVRILGCSNETTWGLTKSLGVSEMHGLARYETIQNNFSLNNRRFEDEMALRFVNERSIEATKKFQAIAAEIDMSIITMATAWSKWTIF